MVAGRPILGRVTRRRALGTPPTAELAGLLSGRRRAGARFSSSVRVNLSWGAAQFVLGAVMLFLAYLGKKAAKNRPD